MTVKEIPLFTKWAEFTEWLFLKTGKFPKNARFIFVSRINNLVLDILDDIIEAKYESKKIDILKRANLRLEKLRVLIRLCYNQKYISIKNYEYAIREINESGNMLGGWIKEKGKKE